jgi:diacylglycerol kinase
MAVHLPPPMLPDTNDSSAARRPPRPWRRKFGDAFRGLKLGIRGQSSFFVHFFFTALVIAAAIVLRCELLEWCLLLGCIGMVLVAELFNSTIETLFRGLDEAARARCWQALDIAAGAVLLASGVAVVIGTLVFLNRLWVLLGSLLQ